MKNTNKQDIAFYGKLQFPQLDEGYLFIDENKKLTSKEIEISEIDLSNYVTINDFNTFKNEVNSKLESLNETVNLIITSTEVAITGIISRIEDLENK